MVLSLLGSVLLVEVPYDLMDGLGIPVSTLTPAGLLALVIALIAFGRLVPRRTMEDVIHDRDEWRTAHRISETARAELATQVEALLEQAKTTNTFLQRVFPDTESRPPRHDPDDSGK